MNWSKVVQKVGGTGSPDIYQDVFKRIIYSYIEEPLRQEEDKGFELGKRNDAGIESWNGSSEDGDNVRRLEDDYTFLESVENSWGSEDYIDDETDDEEDSHDEEDSVDEQDSDDE